MEAYEGYYENDRFFPLGKALRIPGRHRAIITILTDEPVKSEETTERLAALDEFFSTIESSNEEVPEFERVKFNREVDL